MIMFTIKILRLSSLTWWLQGGEQAKVGSLLSFVLVLVCVVGWHHWLNGLKFEQTLGDSGRQRNLEYHSPQCHKELDVI